jgi:hypothetical protein
MRQLRYLIIALGLLVTACTVAAGVFAYPYWQASKSIRQFEVERDLFTPYTLKPYRSLVIRSEKELQHVIAGLKDEMKERIGCKADEDHEFGRCREFEDSVRASQVDFDKESLIVILSSGYSGSIKVGLSPPHLQRGRLECNSWSRSPSKCTRDWVHYAFALVVPNDKVS